MKYYIYGAKAIAFSIYKAMRSLYPEDKMLGFLVTSMEGNPAALDGIPVREIGTLAQETEQGEKERIRILVAAPEDVHKAITQTLNQYGFINYKLMDSRAEAELMEQYYHRDGQFPLLHDFPAGQEKAEISVYAAQFYRDRPLDAPPCFPDYVHSLLLGCAANKDERLEEKAEFCDDHGDNISAKNPDYCEMTAFYWIWKNRLHEREEYVGLYHYRRCLEINEQDLMRLKENDIDAVLQFPMLHAPDIREHHTRYVSEEDWESMLAALQEIHPEYALRYKEIFSKPYFYNYNLILAKKQVFADYCAWLFPVLFRTEQLSQLRGGARRKRYLAYMSESLFTLYFLYHQNDLNICHTGRRMFT